MQSDTIEAYMKKEKLDKIALGTSEVKLSSFFDQESQQRINLKDMFKQRPKLRNKHLNCIDQRPLEHMSK